MALSDYERRVLEEIETELRCIGPSPRRRRLWLATALTACIVLVAGVTTVAALFLPAAGAAATGSAIGLAVGFLFAMGQYRHRF